jgi:beta-glucanase (GH16 family)
VNSKFKDTPAPLAFCCLALSVPSKAAQAVQADELIGSLRAFLFTLAAFGIAATSPAIATGEWLPNAQTGSVHSMPMHAEGMMPAPPSILTAATLPGAVTWVPYSQTLTATGTAPIKWTVTGGALPAGLSLGPSTGIISGTAQIMGTFTVTVSATNAVGSASKELSLTVSTPPTIMTRSPLPTGQTGATYSQTLAATGTNPIKWKVADGALPPGLRLGASTGLISGTPRATGVFTPTITATNREGSNAQQLSLTVNAPVKMSLSPASMSLLPSQTQKFTATVGGTSTAGLTWSYSPSVGNLSTSGTAAVYVAPSTAPTTQTVMITATSLADPSASAAAVVTLKQAVTASVSPSSVSLLPGGTQQFTATILGGINAGTTWSISPALGSISAAGLYTAPAAMPASAAITITATSVSDPTKSASASVTIVPPQAAGYSLAWQDTFSTLNLCSTNVSGCNWYDPGIWNLSSNGFITDPLGTYVNLNWSSAQGSDYTNMTTASMDGENFHAWTFGYIEVSMAFNPASGNWPAIWMLPIQWNQSDGTSHSNGLPYGEIDLFEWISDHPTLGYGTVHVWESNSEIGNNYGSNTWPLPNGTNLSAFNTYGLLWTRTEISWYFNNQLVETFSTAGEYLNQVFGGQQSYDLILSEQAGCNWIYSGCPGGTQSSPLNMQVQWVHIFAPPATAQ